MKVNSVDSVFLHLICVNLPVTSAHYVVSKLRFVNRRSCTERLRDLPNCQKDPSVKDYIRT